MFLKFVRDALKIFPNFGEYSLGRILISYWNIHFTDNRLSVQQDENSKGPDRCQKI